MKQVSALVAAVFLVAASSTANAAANDVVIGRWCDQPVPNYRGADMVITIVARGASAFVRYEFVDGTTAEAELVEQSGAVFVVVDSGHGDRYRVVPGNGELQLIDNDGLIRVARRLENQPTPRDCV